MVTLFQGETAGASLVVDPAGAAAYWVAAATGVINRIPLPDGGTSVALTSPLGPYEQIELAAGRTSLFWTDYSYVADHPGVVNELSFTEPPMTAPRRFAEAFRPSRPLFNGPTLYWLDQGAVDSFMRTRSDNLKSSLDSGGIVGWTDAGFNATAFAVDSSYAYVLRFGVSGSGEFEGALVKRSLKGEGPGDVLATFPGYATSIALDDENAYWTIAFPQSIALGSAGSIRMVRK